jgi:lysozyme
MANAADIKKNYNVWIARYGQYKPDVRLVYWQLCPDGRVNGITGEVDINVFNGYKNQFDEFVKTGFHK